MSEVEKAQRDLETAKKRRDAARDGGNPYAPESQAAEVAYTRALMARTDAKFAHDIKAGNERAAAAQQAADAAEHQRQANQRPPAAIPGKLGQPLPGLSPAADAIAKRERAAAVQAANQAAHEANVAKGRGGRF